MVTTQRLEEMRYIVKNCSQRAANENVRKVSEDLADALGELISRREMVTTQRLEEMRYIVKNCSQRAANENVRKVSEDLADALGELISRREVEETGIRDQGSGVRDDETRRQVEYFAEQGLALTVAETGVDPRIVRQA
jgi:hypothetical protein